MLFRRLSVLAFIHHDTRLVRMAGVGAQGTGHRAQGTGHRIITTPVQEDPKVA